jgi:threonine dehydrogenase-like Zn-dependent dehydrogenase
VGRRVDGSTRREASLLIRGDHQVGSEASISAAGCFQLPQPLDAPLALLVAPLAWALSIWDELELELGDAAVFTEAGPLSALVGQAAFWRGGCPIVELGSGEISQISADAGFLHINSADPETAAADLAKAIASRPGFAAVEMSGRPDVIDVLLEAMPTWSRLALVGKAEAPVTIDFYKNVHKKGAVITTSLAQPAAMFAGHEGHRVRAHVPKAIEILRHPGMSRACQRILATVPTHRSPVVATG